MPCTSARSFYLPPRGNGTRGLIIWVRAGPASEPSAGAARLPRAL